MRNQPACCAARWTCGGEHVSVRIILSKLYDCTVYGIYVTVVFVRTRRALAHPQ